MRYRLMRIDFKHGTIFGEISFDLWNNEYNTGYVIKINIYKYLIHFEDILKYCQLLVGLTYDISYWDKIIRNIKQNKIEWGVIK